MNFSKELNSDYEAKTKPLYARLEKISNRLASLTVDPKDKEVTEAKIAVKGRQREEALASGDLELVARLEKEIEVISSEVQPQSEEIESLNREKDEIERGIDQAKEQTLSQIYPKIRDYCHGEWTKALSATEEAWEGLQQFQNETGVRLSDTIHRNGLTPQSLGTDKELQIRFEKWIF
jgi:chromosome segregation ATPase